MRRSTSRRVKHLYLMGGSVCEKTNSSFTKVGGPPSGMNPSTMWLLLGSDERGNPRSGMDSSYTRIRSRFGRLFNGPAGAQRSVIRVRYPERISRILMYIIKSAIFFAAFRCFNAFLAAFFASCVLAFPSLL